MAKRFNISLPDELAKKLENVKSEISMSEVMQTAIEKQLSRLLKSDEEIERSEALLEAAQRFWKQRRQVLYRGAEVFVEYYIDRAIQDQDESVFKLYCDLKSTSIDKIISERANLADSPSYPNPAEGDTHILQGITVPAQMIERFIWDSGEIYSRLSDSEKSDVGKWLSGYMGDLETIQETNPSETDWDLGDMLFAVRETLAERLRFYLGDEHESAYLR